MEIKYEIKGITLNVNDLQRLHDYYEAACTAEYVLENYPERVKDEKTAMRIGYEVRELMSDTNLFEEEAIEEVLGEED